MGKRTCVIDGCDRPFYGHRWCGLHYKRWRKFGDPHMVGPRGMTVPQRLAHQVQRNGPGECWPWIGCTFTGGYGVFTLRGVTYKTHRLAWELANGCPVPDGLVIRHNCDNPPCCNPAHLTAGTPLDNVTDCVSRGRWVHGEKHGMAKISDQEVREIRLLLAQGAGPKAIGQRYGVSGTQVVRIRDGVSRRTA